MLTTQEKALAINHDPGAFGTFAEIGAGQETARWFFHVGGASATVAKSISAYDMVISDDLYGVTDHYVSRQRLEAMLDREWQQLVDQLDKVRGARSTFFVFCDTIATRSRSHHRDGHGWLGIRFQRQPGGPASEVIIHANLLDAVPSSEQEALGILGVNLIHGVFHEASPRDLIERLLDGLGKPRVDIDVIKFSGPLFETVDNRLISLQLVESGLTDAVMFTTSGEVVQPAEALYRKPVLIERGSFRPATNVTVEMLQRASVQFKRIEKLEGEPVIVMEMTLKNLTAGDVIDHADFLARADILGALGYTVLISNYTTFDLVTAYLRRSTQNWIGMVVGVPTLEAILDERFYADRAGGIMEGLGRLFAGPVRLFVYPVLSSDGSVVTADTMQIPERLGHLLSFLRDNGRIEGIEGIDLNQLPVFPRDVLALIQSGAPEWESFVPRQVAERIKALGLFGYEKRQDSAQ